jgi:ribonuclease HI
MSGGIEIWTDGGCLGNPGPGGWAFVLSAPGRTMERSGFERSTTNNRMELTAVREALRELASHEEWSSLPAALTTDSQYVQKGITEWIHAWVASGWKTAARKPVKNVDLWSQLWELSRARPVAWRWVMGHAGNSGNERCHALVEKEVKQGT